MQMHAVGELLPMDIAVRPLAEQTRDAWGTPRPFFDRLDREFHFTIDACASSGNAKMARYWDREQNGLSQDWSAERVFLNPPYSSNREFVRWLAKASTAIVCVAIVPVRSDTEWWEEMVRKATELRFVRGRMHFDPPKGVNVTSANHCSAVIVYDRSSEQPVAVSSMTR